MQVLRRVLIVVVLTALAAGALAGCGGDEPESADPAYPPNFPVGQVPLIDGEITHEPCEGDDGCERTWVVTVQVQARDGFDPLDEAVELLRDAGYTVAARGDDDSVRWVRLERRDDAERYTVTVNPAPLGGVTYNVDRA